MSDIEEGLIPWGFELEEYVRITEPDKASRAEAWKTAIGLQAVDGLKPSQYLVDTANKHIKGELTIEEVEVIIGNYYQQRDLRTEEELEYEEADTVSLRITKLLNDGTFTFSPAYLKSIHATLFKGLIKRAGAYRDFNMSKAEWILKGDTVRYASWDSIKETVEYDFSVEKDFSYNALSKDSFIKHLAKFTSGIWQIHPFPEGNTRTTAVFIIKYLNTLGYSVNNDLFLAKSWYFRNSLVRANFADNSSGVKQSPEFLEAFFENLLFGATNELKNRFMHLDWKTEQVTEQVIEQVTEQVTEQVNDAFCWENKSSCEQVTEQVTEQVKKLLNLLENNELSAQELMSRLKIKHRPTFMKNYLHPAIAANLVEMTIPEKPNSRLQKYRRVNRYE